MMLSILFLLSCLHMIASADHPASSRKSPVHDPVSNFFSELGDLFLDIDRTLAVQTAPKVEREDNLVTQILKPTSEYFDRIQKNYRNMQKRLGRFIGNTIGHKNRYSDHELSTVGPPQVLAGKQISTTSIPDIVKSDYNPFAAADKERERLSKGFFERQGDISDSVTDAEKLYSAGSSNSVDDCSNEVLSDPILEHIRQEKCNRAEVDKAKRDPKAMLNAERASQILFPLQSQEFDNLSKDILGRIGDLVNSEHTESIRDTSDECSNEILTDPVLELLRQEKCHNAAPGQAEKDVESLLNRKQVAHVFFPSKSKNLEKLSKELLKKYGYTLEEISSASDDECLNAIDTDPVLESIRKDKCARIAAEKLLRQNLMEGSLNPKIAREILLPVLESDFSKSFLKRRGDLIHSEPSNLQNEINAASESLFDKRLRQVLTDHSRWLLDNPLLNRWLTSSPTESSENVYPTEVMDSTIENVPEESTETEPTEAYIPTSTEYKIAVAMSEKSPVESHYYKVVNDDGEVEEKVDIVFKPHIEEEMRDEEQEPKDSVILAFTPDGVPLKLRMGPEIENPLGYLHKALKSAGVSLSVPIESFDDLEPVGKEVLKLGSGLLLRAVYIDVSNRNELKTLLKTLMKFKASKK